jgi:histidinol phosphatase-like PHP family hydrolase
MIDLHVHTLMSDGALVATELVRRVEILDYRAVALTDHVDAGNIESVIAAGRRVAESLNAVQGVKVICGVELTHVPPALIPTLVQRARDLGAELVVVHGETLVEPVAPGTNRAAIEAGVDVLAHPGLITPEEASLAAAQGVALELTVRGGHNLANGHVARVALAAGAPLVVNSDAHSPQDIMTADRARHVALGAGLTEAQYQDCRKNSSRLAGLT